MTDRVKLDQSNGKETSFRQILLVSNKVFHYRVAVYNRLHSVLRRNGYELTVLTNEVQKGEIHKPDFRLIVRKSGFFRYRSEVAEINPSIVILFMHIKDFVVWPLMYSLKRDGIKIIYWNHGVNLQDPDNRIKRFLFDRFHSIADAILLYSQNERCYIAPRHRSKIFVASNTLDFETFPSIRESAVEIKQSLGVPFRKVVLFVGRIDPSKRLDDLLAASQHLDDQIGIVIVGSGLTDEQGCIIEREPRIRYLGEIYESVAINRIFKMADIFSIPGKMGLGINQAMYWGLPIVTERVRHSPEIVYLKDGRNGYMVEKGDVRELAGRINLLLSSPDMYAEFSDAAKSEIRKNASIEGMCAGFLEAIAYADRS